MASLGSFHDKISSLCLNHFASLPTTGKPKATEWTVLSCIVKEEESDLAVIALGTGSKCIGRDKLSTNGDILNDSHAEIMCRRAFLRYIYEHIIEYSATATTIFHFDNIQGVFVLNKNIKFHFFTTFVPCGDAAIFPKQTEEDFGNEIELVNINNDHKRKNTEVSNNEIPNKRIKNDIFRTGAKCLPEDDKQDLHLEGFRYHTVGAVRTKPGRGVSTLSVSCSDKLAKWCHLGIQGALLGLLIDGPIYLSSFTIIGDTPFDTEALTRALFDRLSDTRLTLPYQRMKLEIGQSSNLFSFKYQKNNEKSASAGSIAWLKTKNKRALEVAVEGKRQGITKKQINTPSSRLMISKIELFGFFLQVVKIYEIKLEIEEGLTSLTYRKAKHLNKNYQEMWSLVRKEFKCWTNKPDNLRDFILIS